MAQSYTEKISVRDIFHEVMIRILDGQSDINGILVINNVPQLIGSVRDDGTQVMKPILLRYDAGKYIAVVRNKTKTYGKSSFSQVDDAWYNELLQALNNMSILPDTFVITQPEDNGEEEQLLKLGTAIISNVNRNTDSLILIQTTGFSELYRYVYYNEIPKSTIVQYKGNTLNLSVQTDQAVELLRREFEFNAFSSYASFVKFMNMRFMKYCNVLYPNQLAYLPYMYDGPGILNPLLNREANTGNFGRAFPTLMGASRCVNIFDTGNSLEAWIITNANACRVLGFKNYIPLTGYILLRLIMRKTNGYAIDAHLLLDEEHNYYATLKNIINSRLGTVDNPDGSSVFEGMFVAEIDAYQSRK